MIEITVIDYLKEVLNIPVYAEIPTNRPQSFVVVNKIDGGETNQVNASTLSIYSYGKTLYDAAILNEDVKYAMKNIVKLHIVSGCKIGGDSRSIDEENKLYRYESIFNLYHY